LPEPTLVVVRSAVSDSLTDIPGWTVHPLVVGRQEWFDCPEEDLLAALERCRAVAVTSPRSARWLAQRKIPPRYLRPVLVAGPGTGALLPDCWKRFSPDKAGGAAVARLAMELGHARLLYLSAEESAGTLERQAEVDRVEVERICIYRTVVLDGLCQADRDALDSCRALVFMASSAVRMLAEVDHHRFEFLSRRAVAVAPGKSAADQLRKLGWADVRQAAGPTQADLAKALEAS
jgi:uroporphyrinogen-III synthase